PPRGRPLNGLFFLLLVSCVGCSRSSQPDTLWLGHVAAMTGSDKAAGEHARQGIQVAVEKENADPKDLVFGRKIAFRHANAKSDARDAEAEAVRLVSVNRVVALVGGTDSAQAEQIARGAESVGAPVVLQAALPSPGENTFSIVPSLAWRGQVLGKFAGLEMKLELKVSKVAVFVDERTSAAGQVADAFVAELPKEGAYRIGFKNPDEFAALAVSAHGGKPPAALFAGSGRDLARFRTEFGKVLPGVTILFGGDESSLPSLLADRAAINRVVLATGYLATDETPANQAFVAKYQEQFREPPDVNAALAYDGTRLLCAALRRAGAPTAVKLREALGQTEDFESVTGPLSFGKDHHARRPLFVVQIEKGNVVLRKKYEPAD
ncbi:MAG TPA: ABC transporter substrate-binding protein, partial [Gemmataceae bacterium]|nr:ABC transporter substrate-binding protein [Gemmataceae bacterium]